jgi:aryl-alcohol dehydrogenase-like predicted oxidoreductase
MLYSRREALKTGAAAVGAFALGRNLLAAEPVWLQEAQLMNTIPSSGEQIPAMGLGTEGSFSIAARVLDEHGSLREVLRLFSALGGQVIDAAPTWDPAEGLLGRLTSGIGNKDEIFWAAKISTRASGGRDTGMMQYEQSMGRLDAITLEQIHDLLRWQVQLPFVQDLKEEGRIRYVGVTTSGNEHHQPLEGILRTESLDFVQLDYALDNRSAEGVLIPMARDRGIALVVNSPFSRGRLFQRVGDRPVPEWAQAFGARTWAQFFLKWVLGNESVTGVVPGTSNPEHLRDNMGAGMGRLPNPEERARMARLIDDLPNRAG